MESLSQVINRVSNMCISPTDYDYHKKMIGRIAGPDYIFTTELKELWNILFLYFIGSEEFETYGYSLNKSIALTGLYGVGKSTIFRIIHRWLEVVKIQNPNSFRISSTEEVINIFQSKNWLDDVLILNKTENSYGGGVGIPKPIHILVNEFAYPYDVKHYGTDVKEYIEMFIMKRYDIFQQYRKLTHVTMNFNVKDLDKNFSPRIIDRFREMFNIIELKGKSFRK
jgi:hypothetical protein